MMIVIFFSMDSVSFFMMSVSFLCRRTPFSSMLFAMGSNRILRSRDFFEISF
jgi:hypothetical protein